MQQVLGIGYISRRNDGMTELRINGFQQVQGILLDLLPYLRFKKQQALIMLTATKLLSHTKAGDLTEKHLTTLVDNMLAVQSNNYITKKKKSREEVLLILGLTP